MRGPRIGALFAGYGGLDMAVEDVYGGDVAWYSEIDKGALKILGHRYPDVPNVGSVTDVKWTPDCPDCGDPTALYWNDEMPEGRGYYCPRDGWFDLSIRLDDPDAHRIPEPVDILTGGSPCQDLSHAGRRAGMTDGTRSNLWVAMREAIAQLRPQKVIWENVRGAYSAAADSAVEPCAGCVGDRPAVHLRALGRVLGDLSDLGYDCRWHGLRAADVGAPHGRFRVFVVAEDAQRQGWGAARDAAPGQATGGRAPALAGRPGGVAAGRSLQPACCDPDGVTFCVGCGEDIKRGRRLPTREAILLPTPAAQEPGGTLEDYHARLKAHDGLESTFAPLSMAVQLLPTPRATDGTKGGPNQAGSSGDLMLPSAVQAARWGDYADAIARWEHALGRPAPAPTMTSAKGNPQLAPAFVEWMMGLPAGWVTDVPGITRNEALKALGNGVVPQQAAAAMRVMESWAEVAA